MLWRLLATIYVVANIFSSTAIAEGLAERRLLYLAGVNQKTEYVHNSLNISVNFYPNGFAREVSRSLADRRSKEQFTFYPQGTVKSWSNLLNKSFHNYVPSGLDTETSELKPLLSSTEQLKGLVRGFQEIPTQNLYPAKTDVPSFDRAQFITGDYLFENEKGIMGAFLRVRFEHGYSSGAAESYYNNGSTAAEVTYDKGILNGPYVLYYQGDAKQKVVRERGAYAFGAIEGPVETYYENGNRFFKLTIQNGLLEGEVVAFHPDGKVLEQCQYRSNKRIGECSVTSAEGVLIAKGTYSDGKRDGEWLEWHQNGKPKKVAHYLAGKLDGEVTTFSENGITVKKENYISNALNGPSYHYSNQGKLKAVAEYKNNKKNGFVTTYYLNGKVENRMSFQDDLRHGVQKKFYDSGELLEISEFIKGRQVGISQSFYKSGASMGGGIQLKDSVSYLDRAALDSRR